MTTNVANVEAAVGDKADRSEISMLLPAGAIIAYGAPRAPTGWLKCNGATYSAADYPGLFSALVKYSNVTIAIDAGGAVVSWTSHGLGGQDPVKFTTSGPLPTGVEAGRTYYVVPGSITAHTFQVAATPGGPVHHQGLSSIAQAFGPISWPAGIC